MPVLVNIGIWNWTWIGGLSKKSFSEVVGSSSTTAWNL